MARQKRLNKSLVAFLTVVGMALFVSVAALIIHQGTQRDPEVLAENARQLELSGDSKDLVKAIPLYSQAYAASRETETKYLLDAARCTFKAGGLAGWLELLQQGNSKNPQDQAILRAMADGLWLARQIDGRGFWWEVWRDYGAKLAALDPNGVQGQVFQAYGLWRLGDPGVPPPADVAKADQLVEAAYATSPTDPRVAAAYVDLRVRQANEERRTAEAARWTATERQQRDQRILEESLRVIDASLAEHPADSTLATLKSNFARQLARYARQGGQMDRADELLAQAGEVLERTIAEAERARSERPDVNDATRQSWWLWVEAGLRLPDLYISLARNVLARLELRYKEMPAEEKSREMARAAELTQRATDLDPATYEGYMLQAELKLLPSGAENANPTAADFDASLKVYEDAASATLTLRNFRSMLTERMRLVMLYRGVQMAEGCIDAAGGDAAARQAALDRADALFDDARTRWPQDPITDFIGGEIALVKNNRVEAIQAFQRALDKQPAGRFWTDLLRAPVIPSERLAELYSTNGQLGEAQRFAEMAMQTHEQQLGRASPPRLVLLLADVHNRLDRPRAALELIERYQREYPGDLTLQAARAALLPRIGRKEEGAAIAQSMPGATEGAGMRLWQARLAFERGDYASAAEGARQVLQDAGATDGQCQSALVTLVSAFDKENRRDEAQQAVRQMLASPPRESLVRLLRAYDVVLSEPDAQKRDAKLLEMIQQTPDPGERARQAEEFYASRQDWDKALGYVLEARKQRPDDMELVDREFNLRLRVAEQRRRTGGETGDVLSAANQLTAMLSQANGGRGQDFVGGATYRGQLAMLQGNAELAIREFRQAILGLPKSADLEVALGRAYQLAGRPSEAIEAFKRAVVINPRNVDAHGLLVSQYDDLADKGMGTERDEYARQAQTYFEDLSKLAPTNSFVVARRQRAEEDANPRAAIAAREEKRAGDPNDVANLTRLGDLYVRAFAAADAAQDAAGRQQVAAAGEKFFEAVGASTTGQAQFELVRAGASFYAQMGQREKGASFIQRYREGQTGASKVSAQLLLARFLETQRDPEGAKQEYQAAQALVRETITDPGLRQRMNLQVGLAFIDFYERWAYANQVVEVCQWMLNELPGDSEAAPKVRLKLIDALIRAARLDDADAEIAEYVKAHGEDVAALSNRARVRMSQNRREEARQDLTALIQLDPQNAWALLARAWLYMQRANYDDARGDLAQARPLIAPNSGLDTRLRTLVANLHERQGQLDQAVAEWRGLLATLESGGARPEQIQTVVGAIVRLLRRLEQFDRAQQIVSEQMEKYPADAVWPYMLAQVFESRAELGQQKNAVTESRRDYQAAAGYYQRAAEKADKDGVANARAMAARINALRNGGQAREAIAAFRALPTERPAPGLRLAAARAHWDLGERDAAMQQWQLALADAASSSTGLVSVVATELRQTLLPADAEALLRQVLSKLAPGSDGSVRLKIALAEFLGTQGKSPEALELLKSVLEVATPDTAEHLGALLARGAIQERSRDAAGAIATYREVATRYSDNLMALNNLAYLLVSSEGPGLPQPQEALKYAERLEQLVEENTSASDVLDTVGWVYFKYAQTTTDRRTYLERSIACLEQSLSLQPDRNLPVYDHLAQAYAAFGRTADARSVLTRGLEKAERNNDEVHKQVFEKALRELR